ncbi:MAG: DUF401 family protein [archaeon GB-1867-035]|nr:DUF401 family protein [Candidatus Culexmicrobium profundum]
MINLLIVVSVIVMIILLIKKGVEIGITLLIAAICLSLLLSPQYFIDILYETVISTRTWFLILMSTSIAILAELYRLTGLIEDMGIGLARALRSSKIAVMLTPAIIGLLPVAGGALMSAPIVGALSESLNFTAELSIYANVWFRHTIFMFYPLSQLLITTSTITGLPIELLALKQLPIAIFMIIIGYLIAFRNSKHKMSITLNEAETPLKISAIPLVTALILAVSFRFIIGDFGMLIGVTVGMLALIYVSKASSQIILKSVNNRRVRGIALAAFSIMYLQKSFLISGASKVITEVLTSNTIPIILLEYTLPGFLSLITGSPLTGVVLTLPIMESLTALTPTDVSAIYVSSYLYYLGSPVHLCFVYTAQYFDCSIYKSYKYMVPSIVSSLLFTYLLFTFT